METILDLTDIKYSTYQDFKAYYMKFRFCISSHLKKKGDKIEFLEEKILKEDEIISPTFEEVILLWSLEKISPELPKQVKTTFGSQLTGTTTLKDLQEEIFKIVPALLEGANLHFKGGDDYEPEGFNVDVIIKEEEESCQPDFAGGYPDLNKDKDYILKRKLRFKKKIKRKPTSPEKSPVVNKAEDDGGTMCNVCGKVFEFKKQLYHHRRIHKIEHSVCEICDRSFKCRKYLVDHIYKHHRQTYKCDNCDLFFSTKSRYDEHMTNEHNVQIFSQLENRKNSVKEDDLDDFVPKKPKLNWKRETNSDSYTKCDICDKNFLDRNKLTTHMRTVHRELQPEHCVCEFCEKSFMCKKNLYSHKFKMHNVTLHCGKCDFGFENREEYDCHMESHTCEDLEYAYLMCFNCGIVMHGKANFDEHMKEHVNGGIYDMDDDVKDDCDAEGSAFHNGGDHKVDSVGEDPPSPPDQGDGDDKDDYDEPANLINEKINGSPKF